MITLDIEEFKSNIKSLEDTSARKYTRGIQYLYDTVYSALTDGKDIHIGDIDFSLFSKEEYEDFHNNVELEENSARGIYSVFDRSASCSISESKMFF